jgi:ferrous iron transport protein A
MVEITRLKSGEESVVVKIKGGKDFYSRMASLGLTEGSLVKVIQNFGKGPMIILVRDTRIALGRGEAEKIMVNKKDG